MLNRKSAPPVILPQNIHVPQANANVLRNGARLLWISSGSDPVCRLDIIFNAGSRYQNSNLVATAAFSTLSEGTTNHSSQQIAEHFDFYGSFIDLSADRDWGRASLYCLKRHFAPSIEMFAEVLKSPIFPAKELETWCTRNKQNLLVELDKTATLARQAFFGSLFGDNHPYGRFAQPNDYDNLKPEQLVGFHSKFIGSINSILVLSGDVDETEIGQVEKHFGDSSWGTQGIVKQNGLGSSNPKQGVTFIEKQGAVQSSIRIGCELFKRDHPDYSQMLVLNTVLGGFFGSRLMKNLREEKGFTYGIGSNIVSLRDAGFIVISTEVGAQFTQMAIDEIFMEVKRMQTELMDDQELQQVKSYMWGEALRSFNGPFAIADSVISLLNFNELNYGFYTNLFETIRSINPKDIAEMANKWLDADRMVIGLSGPQMAKGL